jgi:hypothetical protein
MKGQIVRMAVAMLLVVGLSAANAGTQKPAKTQKPSKAQIQTYTGTVKVTKDKAGQITDAKLSVGKILPHKYNIVLDKEGRDLAARMDGKRVQVKGRVEKKSGKTLLLVKGYSPVASKSAKKAASKPAKTTAPKSTNSTTKR